MGYYKELNELIKDIKEYDMFFTLPQPTEEENDKMAKQYGEDK